MAAVDIEVCQLQEFRSIKNPLHKVQYTHLKPDAIHTLILCYGAGGRATDSTLYQSFIDNHSELALLCIDRWTLSTDSGDVQNPKNVVARHGPALLSDLTSITIELLDSLSVGVFSIAAHSAGAYQMLDLVKRCAETGRIGNVFSKSTHIPSTFLSSAAMTWMSKAPDFIFNCITQMDTKLVDSPVGRLLSKRRLDDKCQKTDRGGQRAWRQSC